MFNKLHELFGKRHELPDQDREVIESLHLETISLEALEEMKKTAGWKLLEGKLKQEVQKVILEKVKDDQKIQTLLQILGTVETKQSIKLLEEEITRIIP